MYLDDLVLAGGEEIDFSGKEEVEKAEEEEGEMEQNNINMISMMSMNVNTSIMPETKSKFTILDEYLYSVVENLVDDVCLYDVKINKIRSHYESQLETINNKEAEIQIRQQMQKALNNVPLRSIPYKLQKQDTKYKKIISVEIFNERNAVSGKFGW